MFDSLLCSWMQHGLIITIAATKIRALVKHNASTDDRNLGLEVGEASENLPRLRPLGIVFLMPGCLH